MSLCYKYILIMYMVVVDLAPSYPFRRLNIHVNGTFLHDDLEVGGTAAERNGHPDLDDFMVSVVTESVSAHGNLGADIPPQRSNALLANS